ncbi:MAG: GAF domain-containing protein [Chloroflexota bacterium]
MESQSESSIQRFLSQVLKWSGGYYLVLSSFVAQMGSNFVAIPVIIIAQINAEFSPAEFDQLTRLAGFLALLGNAIVWFSSYFLNKKAFRGLQRYKKGSSLIPGSVDELTAWQQAGTWTWKYAIIASCINFIVVGISLLSYSYFYLHATYDQLVYIVISITIITLSIVTLDVSILDRLLVSVRHALLPKDFDTQLAGASGFTLLGRIYIVVPAMIVLSILLVAPIGYHQTFRVLYEEIGSTQVLSELQVQSILVSAFAIFLGLGLVSLFSISLTRPLNEMISVFKKVEQGNLKQRARISASDEIAQVTIYFNRMISRLDELQETLERQVEDRTAQLRAINEVGRVATSILDPDKLMSSIVSLIREQFGHYYTAIYLVDSSNRWAELVEATGEAGQVMKNSKHRLEINEQTIIGRAIKRREAQVALDTDKDNARFEHPLLPYTRSETALPLIIGDRILGALDVQSTQEAAFSQQDIETLQNMTNQVAIALENAHLFQETQRNLQELRNIQRQYLRQAWGESNLPRGETTLSIGDDTETDNEHAVEIPIALRDQVIGKIRLERGENVTPEEQTWMQAIATQTALALENARLLEETQNIANREKTIADISNKIWTSTTMEGILQTAIRELGITLDATEATIELTND